MTMTAGDRSAHDAERSVRLYRGLLVAYPRPFRREYEDDLVQAFRDLLTFGDRRGVWARTMRDLVTSAAKERGAALLHGRGPSVVAAFVVVALLVAGAVTGRAPWVLVPLAALVALPALGIAQLRRAWVVRRTTGAPAGMRILAGAACFVPGVAFVVAAGAGRVFWIGFTIAVVVVAGAAVGALWGAATLIASARDDEARSRRKRAVLVIVPALVVLGIIVGGSYNSWRGNQPPPGDHSVENASAATEALYQAAGAGDVEEVTRLAATCADPWVQFPAPDGKHNARGLADSRVLEVPDEDEAPYEEIIDVLTEAMETWGDRCGP